MSTIFTRVSANLRLQADWTLSIPANPHTDFELDGSPMSALGQKQTFALR
jgi:hypothetical protein